MPAAVLRSGAGAAAAARVALRTRGSWVQILPGAPAFKHLEYQNQVLRFLARPLRDWLSTGARVSSALLAVRDPQDCPRSNAIEYPIGEADETSHIGARVELWHRSHGVTEQGAAILLGDTGGT